jgi:hypothetical protein
MLIFTHITETETVMEWLTLLLHFWEVLGSNPGSETGMLTEGFHSFPQSLQENAGIVS